MMKKKPYKCPLYEKWQKNKINTFYYVRKKKTKLKQFKSFFKSYNLHLVLQIYTYYLM